MTRSTTHVDTVGVPVIAALTKIDSALLYLDLQIEHAGLTEDAERLAKAVRKILDPHPSTRMEIEL